MPCPCGSRLIWRYYHYFNGHSGLATYVHRVICVPSAECTLCIPRHWWGGIKLCQSRINKWKLIFPTEWLALNPLFTEILFLSGYFKFDFMWTVFQIYNTMCYKEDNKRKCKVTRRFWSLSEGIAISISVFGGFSYLKLLEYITEL